MTGKKLLRGYFDRMRENLETLDEQIENARKMSKPKGKSDKAAALQWAKTLRDLVELRNTSLGNIKAHLLGRDETGVPNEPEDFWDHNQQVTYERYFRAQMQPWTLDDLKLECEDCGVESEDVSHRDFEEIHDSHYHTLVEQEDADLCPKCIEKRNAVRREKAGKGPEAASDPSEGKSERDRLFFSLAPKGPLAEASNRLGDVLMDSVQGTVSAIVSGNHPSAEKVKMLEDFKAKMCKTADEQGSTHLLEPSLALIDKEIERLKAESGG